MPTRFTSSITRVVVRLASATALTAGLLSGCTGDSSSSSAPSDSGSLPAGLSQFTDVPIPSGASYDQAESLLLGSQNEWLGRLVLRTSNTTRSMAEFYGNEMRRFGWIEVTTVRGEPSFLTFSRGNRVATVQITSRTVLGALVTITMSPRGQDSGASSAPAPGAGSGIAAPPSGPIQVTPLR